MSVINVTVSGVTTQTTLVESGDVVNVTFADQSGGGGINSAATIEVGTTTTLSPTASASVVNVGTAYAAKLNFGIPSGPVSSLAIGTVSSGTAVSAKITGTAPSQVLSLVLTPGPANSLSIGTVKGGTAASATISGAAPSQTLSLVLPEGPQGPAGPAGPSVSNSLSIGSVTTGTTASVSITGTAPSQVLSFVLQPGPAGAAGGFTTIQVGTTKTGEPGSNASVSAVSNGSTVTLNFAIPRGADGSAANLTDETPQPLGSASAGTASKAARADHVHAVPTISYSNLANVPSTFAPAAHQHALGDVNGLQAALDGKQAAGNYCPLVNNLVPSSFLPSYVDDVVDVGGTLPASGDVGKIYVVSTGGNVNKIYRWSGSAFVEISPSPGSTDAVPEGSVNLYHTTQRAAAAAPVQSVAGRTGSVTLTTSDIGGLQTALNGKQAAGNYVTTLNGLSNAVTLKAGDNIAITSSGSTITVASTGIGANDAVDGDFYGGFIPSSAITITSQPASAAAAGGSATFSVTATSTPSGQLSYQWQKQDGASQAFVNIPGEQSSTISLSGLLSASDDGDRYRVVVSSTDAVSVISNAATLTVLPNIISITSQPTNQSTSTGSATFSVTASVSPSGTPAYQWQRSQDGGSTWANISGATSSSLALTGLTLQSDNGALYRVFITATNATSVTSNSASLTVVATWKEISQRLRGGQVGEGAGTSVSVSGDGQSVVAGAPYKNGNPVGVDNGMVYVKSPEDDYFHAINAIGDSGSYTGQCVKFNYDGSLLLILEPGTDPQSGRSMAYVLQRPTNTFSSAWVGRGGIYPTSAFNGAVSAAINDDGSVIAVSDHITFPIGSTTRVYYWSGSQWVQRGSDIVGEVSNDQSGYSEDGTGVSLSADGNIIAIGAYGNDGNGTSSGHVRVYQWSGSAWVQRGGDIDGANQDANFGYSVCLSGDGNVLAAGAPRALVGNFAVGHARVYEWSGLAWVQRGSDINGASGGDRAGASVSLSKDGTVLAVGLPGSNEAASDGGAVRVYRWG